MDSRVAVVTGATSGMGRAISIALGDDGWCVYGIGREDDGADALREDLACRAGGKVTVGDLRQQEVVAQLVASASAAGRLELLVNCAGIHALADATATSDEMIRRILDVNVVVPLSLAREMIPVMASHGGGTIINIGSEAGVVAVPSQVAYNVSKAAIAMLSRSIVVDHAADGIRAVTISPGTTRTPLVEKAIAEAADPAAHEAWLASSRPAARLGRPEEIAAAVAFVASGKVNFMTGNELLIDGGYTAR